MQAIIYGAESDIAGELRTRMERDGWTVAGVSYKFGNPKLPEWDLLLIAQGTMEPIGKFFDTDADAWDNGVRVNALGPLRFLRAMWPNGKPGCTIVFISGPNPTVATPTYTSYRAGKLMLEGLIGTLNAEYPEARFRWLIPGKVKTKIHLQALRAGDRAGNIEVVRGIMDGTVPTVSHDEVYEKFKACIA